MFCSNNLFSQYTPIFSVLENYRRYGNEKFTIRPIHDTNFLKFEGKLSKKSWFHRKLFQEHLFEANSKDFYVRGDYYLDYQIGKENVTPALLTNNSRGFGVEGKLGQFSFYANIYENQFTTPNYITQYLQNVGVYPGLGTRDYDYSNHVDFTYSAGGISYKFKKFFTLQLANDKIFIGNGYRSLLLSDAATPYPFFRITTQIGRFQYSNIYAQMINNINYNKSSYYIGYNKKFFVGHYLEYAAKKWHFGLFEGVVLINQDSTGYRGFEFGYLNPVIFLRPTEYTFGSPDNALIGFNVAFDINKNTQLYGQIVIDEFYISEIFKNRGFWANKQGFQLGIKSKKLFKKSTLSGFSEINLAPPYTYTASIPALSYTHFSEALAHPIGANFYEWVNRIEWNYNRWYVYYQLNLAKYGINGNGFTNVGQNLLQSYITRDHDYGNYIGQGVPIDFIFSNIQAGWVINPKNNLRIEFQYIFRNENINGANNISNIFYVGLRSSFRNIYLDR
ncbi:MAG: hypothetical protein ORN85_02450 [Sediminibacterium sp.]|nr:hypothetical protein [Sediminibacterium sp.]